MAGAPIEAVTAAAYTIPTDKPEADGTFAWSSATLVVVEVMAGGMTGLGYTYSDASAAGLATGMLREALVGGGTPGIDALDPPMAWDAMVRAVRNVGRSGVAATAISAVDAAIWDLKARLLGLPLASLLGRCRESVPIYGSGGFTSYTDQELCGQLAGWVERDGCHWVKMKIGTDPARDPHRVATAKRAIGDATLFVDANGAFAPKEALRLTSVFAAQGVAWFEEPVSSDDVAGLALVRRHLPPGMELAAGEYAFHLDAVRGLLGAGAVDVQQADLTRCCGVTGFLRVAALCDAFHTDLSGHCAPALHLHAACAAPRFRHLEWFHDHVRIEAMLFDGAPRPQEGRICPDLSRPGHGLVFKQADAEKYRAK